VGFFGTRDFVSYSMTGPTVNLAAWLERACKHYGTSIIVSETTHHLVADKMVLRRLDRVRPKGRAKPEWIYELVGQQGCIEPELDRSVHLFTEAQDLREAGRWSEAARLFREVIRLRSGDDAPAARLLRRCENLARRTIPSRSAGAPSSRHPRNYSAPLNP
jgi:adenylate cyclase